MHNVNLRLTVASAIIALLAGYLCSCGPPPLILPSVPVPIPVPPTGDPPPQQPPEQLRGALARLEGLMEYCWEFVLIWHETNGWQVTTKVYREGMIRTKQTTASAPTLDAALREVTP